MHVCSIGTVSTSKISISDVFHVPKLSYNLLVVDQLAELGYRIILDYFGCIVQHPRTGQELGNYRRIGRLFEISSLRLPATGVSAATIPQTKSSDHSSGLSSDVTPHSSPESPARAPSEDHALATILYRSSRVTSLHTHLHDFHCYTALATLHEPHSYREASSNPLWQAAMIEELDALSKNRTWDLVDLSPDKSVVGCKWVFKVKTRSNGSIERYKDRLAAKGFTQEYGIYYEETFAPVAHLSSICTLLAVAASRQ